MAFWEKQRSRDKSNPARLFLFRGTNPALESIATAFEVGPGDLEFGYGTTEVKRVISEPDGDGGTTVRKVPLNRLALQPHTDFVESLDDLQAIAPGLQSVTICVTWFGTDLRAGSCSIEPRVMNTLVESEPYDWHVGNLTRDAANAVTVAWDRPAFNGTPSDRTVYEAIREVKRRGLRCTLHPTLEMDIPTDNALPGPFGSASQPAYPWRGKITCNPAKGEAASVWGTSTAATQVANFFGPKADTPPSGFGWDAANKRVTYNSDPLRNDKGYRKFVLHAATLAAQGGADDFLLGSELAGLTSVKGASAYPAVDELVALVRDVRTLVGTSVSVSYGADIEEYGAQEDGQALTFHMDKLWADSDVDYVGISYAAPLSDWRDGSQHLDYKKGFYSIHDIDYLKSNIEGGELYDWRYANDDARNQQNRTAISDALGETWAFRPKDLRGWWANAHRNRNASGQRSGQSGPWGGQNKPIRVVSVGCGSVNKGSNEPRAWPQRRRFHAPYPRYSNERPDSAIMRAYAEAFVSYWQRDTNNSFMDVDRLTVRGWDARPYPVQPDQPSTEESALFKSQDSEDWRKGLFFTGKLQAGRSFEAGEFGPYAFTDSETPITRGGITFQPWPIEHGDISTTGTLDKSDLDVTMALGSGFENEFNGFPPSQVVNLTIFQGQMDDEPSLTDYPALWVGRVASPRFTDNEAIYGCVPVSTSIKRPGLRRNYQIGCPHVLYGSACRANKGRATMALTVSNASRGTITFSAVPNHERYRGGLLVWTNDAGRQEVRTIVGSTDQTLRVRGGTSGLEVGAIVSASWGCDHTMGERGCALHDNIFNFGGQFAMPEENPLSQKNMFY